MTQTQETTKFYFTKMTGAGNDFLIFDARAVFPSLDRPRFVQALCRRSQSIGADGVVFIERPTQPDTAFKWDFYNADGSSAEMCGNASRCVTRYAIEKKMGTSPLKFETVAGIIKTQMRPGGLVEVELTPPILLEKDLELLVGEHVKIQVTVVNTGVPHVVKENDDWDDEYLNDMGGYLRRTKGANGTFYEVTGPSEIQSATFERGVEAVTLACGTGAVAAAFVAVSKGQVKSPVEVHVPGGRLEVVIEGGKKPAKLIGDARFICEGTIYPEALL